jgi:hypothetical protein
MNIRSRQHNDRRATCRRHALGRAQRLVARAA